MSNHFARSGKDKFADLTLDQGLSDAPLLQNCSARFQCKTCFQYEGGDHIIFVGEVVDYDHGSRPPLLYVTGDYALATRKSNPVSTDPSFPQGSALFSEELLGYLLGRSHYQFMSGFRGALSERGLSEPGFFVLSTLSVREPMSAADIAGIIAYTGIDIGPILLGALCDRCLLHRTDTPEGPTLSLIHI